jgi:AcrR family transcriptional regulator
MTPRSRTPAAATRPGRRSPATAAATRARLLRHAERLFARKGYGATSLRELAAAAGVRLFTVQHHFGSKQRLYEEVLRRWDEEVATLMAGVLATAPPQAVVERVVDALFDFFLAHRDRVALNARAALGEGLPRRLALGDLGWVRYINASRRTHGLGDGGLDPGLLLISVEGLLHNHVLAAAHYRLLFGREVTDPRLAARVKRHLQQIIRALLGQGQHADGAAARAPRGRRREPPAERT